jgi:putative phosphoesterase
MRVALISDLHANLVALETALTDIARRRVDRVVCLGDIADLGPEPHATNERLRAMSIPCIQGNHDSFVEEFPGLMDVVEWCKQRLTDEDVAFLATLPASLRLELAPGVVMLCVHGSPHSYDEPLLVDTPSERLDEWTLAPDVHVVVAGHTHVQLVRRHGGRTFVNVGSVGQPFLAPFDGQSPPVCLRRAEYAIVQWDAGQLNIELKSVPLDFARYEASVRAAGFPNPDAWLAHWQAP